MEMPKIPAVVQVAVVTCATLVLSYLIEYFTNDGAAWEYASAAVLVCTLVLRTIEVKRRSVAAGVRRMAGYASIKRERSDTSLILLGD